MRRTLTLAARMLVVLLLVSPGRSPALAETPRDDGAGGEEGARPPVRMLAQLEVLRDSGGETFWDPTVWLGFRQAWAQVWAGELTRGAELGGYFKDRRRSAYTGWYRYREEFDHVVELSSEQVVGGGFVAFGAVRLIRVIPRDAEDRSLVQPSIGFDKYYGDYNFLTVRAIRDPRGDHEWTFVLSHRLADAERYLTLGVVPRTDGSVGYFVHGKWRWLRAGAGRYDRFDFTDKGRTIVHVGVELEF